MVRLVLSTIVYVTMHPSWTGYNPSHTTTDAEMQSVTPLIRSRETTLQLLAVGFQLTSARRCHPTTSFNPVSFALRHESWCTFEEINFFTHRDSPGQLLVWSIHRNPLNHFCSYIMTLWTNSWTWFTHRISVDHFCSCIGPPFVHSSQSSERILDDRRHRRLDATPPNVINHDSSPYTTGTSINP